MKNTQRGFIVPLIIVIVVLLGVGGYVYNQKLNLEIKNDVSQNNSTSTDDAIKKPIEKTEVADIKNLATSTKSSTTSTPTDNVTVTKYTESSNNGISYKGDVTTSVDCGTEDCFNKKFIACEPATMKAEAGAFGSVEYKIIGKGKVGCNMTFKYTNYPDPLWVNKELTCEWDNKGTMQESMQKVFAGIPNGTVICTGPLYNILRGSR